MCVFRGTGTEAGSKYQALQGRGRGLLGNCKCSAVGYSEETVSNGNDHGLVRSARHYLPLGREQSAEAAPWVVELAAFDNEGRHGDS